MWVLPVADLGNGPMISVAMGILLLYFVEGPDDLLWGLCAKNKRCRTGTRRVMYECTADNWLGDLVFMTDMSALTVGKVGQSIGVGMFFTLAMFDEVELLQIFEPMSQLSLWVQKLMQPGQGIVVSS